MTTNETCADLIRAAMKEADRTQKWTADNSGIHIATFRRKLLGGGEFTIGEVARIARALRVRASTLLPSEFHSEAAAAA